MHIRSQYPELPPLPETNLHHVLLRRPDQAEWPNYSLHIDPKSGRTRGFRDFIERVQFAATALGALGLSSENGDIVGILCANSMDYITLVHACLYITTPFVLISSHSKPFELQYALTLSKATCLFVDEKFLSTVLPIAKKVGISLKRIFIMTGHATSGRKSFSQLIDDVRTRKAEIINVRPAKNDTLAYLIFSSGTSGLPKAVMISHGNILFTLSQNVVLAKAISEVITPPTINTPEGIPRFLAFLPLHHSYGLVVYCFLAFLTPRTFVMMSTWNTDLALTLVPKYHITHLTMVPSIIHQLVHHPKTAKADMSSVISMSSGAAYLPPELGEKMTTFAPKEARFGGGYGMSECTLSAIIQPLPGMFNDTIVRKRGATGILYPGMEARILLDDGITPVAGPNQVGELWLKGHNVALGYWNNEEATRETFVGGWLRTGDRFWVDEEGYFFFADRAKDTLKVSGAQVSPVEIENVLLAHPMKLIQDVTVAGVSGGRTSDEKVPRAWVVPSPEGKKLGAAKVVRELEKWHRENLSNYKWLRGGIEVIREIPKSPTGKVLRRELQERYEKNVARRTNSKL